MNEGLDLWVIYDHPRDYPGHFVVRKQTALAGKIVIDKHCQLTRTLDEARKLLPPGLYPIGRQPGDDAFILEVWV